MSTDTTSAYTAATTAASVGVNTPSLRPKMMMNGSTSAQNALTNACPSSFADLRGGGTIRSFLSSHHHADQSAAAMSSPGMIPARNSLVIERFAATSKMTKPIDGGITGPMIPEAAIKPPALGFACPAATIIGTSSAESAAASATAEPESAERMHAATIAT